MTKYWELNKVRKIKRIRIRYLKRCIKHMLIKGIKVTSISKFSNVEVKANKWRERARRLRGTFLENREPKGCQKITGKGYFSQARYPWSERWNGKLTRQNETSDLRAVAELEAKQQDFLKSFGRTFKKKCWVTLGFHRIPLKILTMKDMPLFGELIIRSFDSVHIPVWLWLSNHSTER